MQVEGDVTSSSTDIGFVGGATFEGVFKNNWALRFDPQVRTLSNEVLFEGSTPGTTGSIEASGSLQSHNTFLDLPVQIAYARSDEQTWYPFIAAGAMLTFPTISTARIDATQTALVDENVVSVPLISQYSGTSLSEKTPWISLLVTGGVRVPLSDKWEFSTEARLQQLVSGGHISTVASGNVEVFTISLSAPKTSISIVAGIMLRL